MSRIANSLSLGHRTIARFALFWLLAFLLPACWYVAYRAWFEPGDSLWSSLVAPDSALVFWLPITSTALAWWLALPPPHFTVAKLISLAVALPLGLVSGILFGLGFTCSYLDKCM